MSFSSGFEFLRFYTTRVRNGSGTACTSCPFCAQQRTSSAAAYIGQGCPSLLATFPIWVSENFFKKNKAANACSRRTTLCGQGASAGGSPSAKPPPVRQAALAPMPTWQTLLHLKTCQYFMEKCSARILVIGLGKKYTRNIQNAPAIYSSVFLFPALQKS
jgi:hypothetical protein